MTTDPSTPSAALEATEAGGAVADCCCPHINLHVGQAAAGRAFGSLLGPSNPPEEAP